MQNDDKLKIALEALKELKDLEPTNDADYGAMVELIASDALHDIQREHYLGTPSPVVAELIGAKSLRKL